MQMKSFGDLLYILMISWFPFLPICNNLHGSTQIYISQVFSHFLTGGYLKWNTKIPRGQTDLKWIFLSMKITIRSRNNYQGFPCPPSFPLTSFIIFLIINLGGWQFSIKDASWSRDVTSVIFLTLWLPSWKEKSTSSKFTLVVFLYYIISTHVFYMRYR